MALNLRNLEFMNTFKTGSMNYVVQKIERYKIKLIALQDISWNDSGLLGDTTILYGNCNNQQFGTGYGVYKNLVPAIKSKNLCTNH